MTRLQRVNVVWLNVDGLLSVRYQKTVQESKHASKHPSVHLG